MWFLRCAWGTCNADDRYPERLNGVGLILFPKPKTNCEKCLRWINACGRPHRQLNADRINKHKGVFKLKCCTHVLILVVFISLQNFVGGNGPIEEHPDPIPADGSKPTLVRKPPTKRKRQNALTD